MTQSLHDTKHTAKHTYKTQKTGYNEHVRYICFGCVHDTLFANTFLVVFYYH